MIQSKRMMIAMEYSRQHVVDVLRRAGWPDLADEASRVLPDSVDIDRLVAWGAQHGLSHDELMSRFGASP
jgi:hypothetical protein